MLSETKFQDRLKKKKQSERNGLRYKRLIAEIVKKIFETNNPKLTNNAIKEIALKIYKNNDLIRCSRIKGMISQELVKNDINSELQRILTDRAIKPLEKIVELTQKGEDAAKNTSDYINVAKFYKELAEIEPKKGTKATYSETTDFSKIGKDGNPAVKVTKTLEMTTDEAVAGDVDNDNSEG